MNNPITVAVASYALAAIDLEGPWTAHRIWTGPFLSRWWEDESVLPVTPIETSSRSFKKFLRADAALWELGSARGVRAYLVEEALDAALDTPQDIFDAGARERFVEHDGRHDGAILVCDGCGALPWECSCNDD